MLKRLLRRFSPLTVTVTHGTLDDYAHRKIDVFDDVVSWRLGPMRKRLWLEHLDGSSTFLDLKVPVQEVRVSKPMLSLFGGGRVDEEATEE